MTVRTTYTYAVLEVSPEAYGEIAQKLRDAGYGHVFHGDSDHAEVIDMHGIALAAESRRSGPDGFSDPE